jgi:hypothetical protein
MSHGICRFACASTPSLERSVLTKLEKSRGPTSSGLTLPDGSFHAKQAAIEDDGRIFVAVKANVNLTGNPSRHGKPTIQGALTLVDGV